MNALKTFFTGEIERWIVRFLPLIIRRALKNGLHAVWQRGAWEALPSTGAVLAVNHHSWWDVYLCWLLRQKLSVRMSGIMRAEQLERFRFFRRVGVISDAEVREALRRLERGDLLFIFPEGSLKQAGGVSGLHRGVSFLASRAGVPVYPVAFRVTMRGAQYPEAFVVLGERHESRNDNAAFLTTLQASMNELLLQVDKQIAATPAEEPPAHFEAWLTGRESFSTRMAWVKRLWAS